MKIVFVISQLGGGGAERVVSILSGSIAEKGHDVSVITLLEGENVYQLHSKVKLVELKCSSGRLVGTVSQVRKLRNTVKALSPDIIISFLPVVNMTTLLSCAGLKRKIIVSERNDPYQTPRKKYIRRLRDCIYRLSDGYVFQTPDAKKYFDDRGLTGGAVIPNPLSDRLPTVYVGKRRRAFVTAVRLEPQKNLKMLIDAFCQFRSIHPEYTLEIYGDGGMKGELKEQISSCNASEFVLLMGFANDLYQRIQDAYAFVLPSNYEGMSNSLIEALGMGIPVISTDHPIGGARMFIDNDRNGLLIGVNDTKGLIGAMCKLVEQPELGEKFSSNSVAIRAFLSLENITENWLAYIDKVLRKENVHSGRS